VISLRRALLALGAAAVVATGLAVILAVTSEHLEPALALGLGLPLAWAFVGTGLYAWWRRPANRFGALMTGVGFAFFIPFLTAANDALPSSIGVLGSFLYLAAFIHMVLAYPEGRIALRGERRLVAAFYVLALVAWLPDLLLSDLERRECPECPGSAFQVADAPAVLARADQVLTSLAVVGAALVAWRLLERWQAAPAAARAAQTPFLLSGVALVTLIAGMLTTDAVGAEGLTELLNVLGLVAFGLTPPAFLFGLLRSRVARAGAVSELLAGLGGARGPAALRDRLARALEDASLALAYRLEGEGAWVDADGRAFALPGPEDPDRAWTSVELDGRCVGALVHARVLCEDPDFLRSVAAAAALAVENERLGAQLRARVEELRASRARIVREGMAERRRLERDLHDGAQQRLVSLSLTLRLAQGRLGEDPEGAGSLLGGAQEELALALEELRELARGIHPAVLSDRGLDAALEALAGRSTVPVELAGLPPERFPAPVEAAAYYVVAEALTNIAKYAEAKRAVVRVARHNGTALVEVADDGVGGADPERGTGLRGLADRLAAIDGRLELSSPPGAGTRLRAEIPV